MRPEDLDMVACGVGPGMFTGVRVAIATAKGIAMGRNIDVVATSTLDAVACSTPREDGASKRLALLDARRGEVYASTCTIDGLDLRHERTPSCAPLADVLDDLKEPHVALGSGLDDTVAPHRFIVATHSIEGPTPEGLWHAAVASYRRDGASSAASLCAVYLRKSYAELGLNPPKRAFVKSPFV